MPRPWCFLIVGLALTAGCAAHHSEPQNVGLISPAQRADDLRDDRIRLLGVDRAPKVPLDEPFYDIPGTAISAGFDAVFVSPTVKLYMYFTGDTAANAARQMLDEQSADNRRHGILRMAQEKYAREGAAENDLWADMARTDKDYTVRAAGIRALNWARDPRHTPIFITALDDEKPLVRLEAAKALANVPDPNSTPSLLSHLQSDISRDVRIACADALRCYKSDEVAHALITCLTGSDFGVAWQARQSLRLMTAHDFQYDEQAWISYLANNPKPFP